MEPYFAGKTRVVSLDVLEKLCAMFSGMTHTFEASQTSPNRVRVYYSNPDEYGNPRQIEAHFPCWKGSFGLVYVALDIVRILGTSDEEAYQFFDVLINWDYIFRNPKTGEIKTYSEEEYQKVMKEKGAGNASA